MTPAPSATTLVDKARELCEAILTDGNYIRLMEQVDAFLDDDDAKEQYRAATELGQELQHKQRSGLELEPSEIRKFEELRDGLFANDVIREFLDAQNEIGEMQGMLTSYVKKTIELGRVPSEDELGGGGCCGGGGGGCGCGH